MASSSTLAVVEEGAVAGIEVERGAKPGSTAGYFAPLMRLNRDLFILGVAAHLVHSLREARRRSNEEIAGDGEREGGDGEEEEAGSSPSRKRRRRREGDASNPPALRRVAVLDAFAAAGPAGLRVACESSVLAEAFFIEEEGREEDAGEETLRRDSEGSAPAVPLLCVLLNDLSTEAVALARSNAARAAGAHPSVRTCQQGLSAEDSTSVCLGSCLDTNKAEGGAEGADVTAHVETSCRRADVVMHEEPFDYIHLDPFGSVVPHLDSALSRSPHGSRIGLTATDISTLYGAYDNVAWRKYGAVVGRPRHTCFREFGARMLLAAVAMAAGRHDRGITPLVVVSKEHFVHAQVLVKRGGTAADWSARLVMPIVHCVQCDEVSTGAESVPCDDGSSSCRPDTRRVLGPIWCGPLFDLDAVRSMHRCSTSRPSSIHPSTQKLLRAVELEAAVDEGRLFTRRPQTSLRGRDCPKVEAVVSKLIESGFCAAKSHFDPHGIRSNAGRAAFLAAVDSASR
jgi:tRNA G26 N,N-dimethylase Trm1